jgi:hypothetical protein
MPVARNPSTQSLGVALEDKPNTSFEAVFGISSGVGTDHGSDDFASVFRNPTSGGGSHRPPPGLSHKVESSGSSLLSAGASPSHEYGLNDGWGNPSLIAPSHQNQSRMRAHTDGEALLAENLISILNLSGARGESDTPLGQNAFVSRIDPELDCTIRSTSTVSPMSRFPTISPSQNSHETFSTKENSPFERRFDEKPRFF